MQPPQESSEGSPEPMADLGVESHDDGEEDQLLDPAPDNQISGSPAASGTSTSTSTTSATADTSATVRSSTSVSTILRDCLHPVLVGRLCQAQMNQLHRFLQIITLFVLGLGSKVVLSSLLKELMALFHMEISVPQVNLKIYMKHLEMLAGQML